MPLGREKAIFLSALELGSESARAAYVAAACCDDRELRDAVDGLLAAHEQPGNVLDADASRRAPLQQQFKSAARAFGLEPTLAEPIAERAEGREFHGNYWLLEKLGEGGFGQVYVAEQKKPVRRRVAIKVLKSGMLSREAIARFEAEGQALALMDHPNIARVFDAGTTESGQPYFVMELVRGVHITGFCRQYEQTIDQRLRLFVNVCHAVQHAHQKGVIHRDLKPSNVLVTLHDATPVVKVIDFGVAKALHEPLTEKTIYTRFAQMIGTPMYMSPEQAEMNSLDVDTRSDIYSLGVLLYELLTETTPFDQQRLQTATFDEMRRMIREEDPPRPSARVSTLSRSATSVAALRQTQPRLLASELRGDLDWIVMKALEKDRKRRYETAADLARDVQRYLDQQPVIARPPSQWYRFTRFAGRNKAALIATSLVLFALLSGTVVSTWQAIRATSAKREADALRKDAVDFADRLKEANVLLDSARANADEQRWPLALAEYTKATALQPNHYLTWSGRGFLYARLGAFRLAAADYAQALQLGAPANNPAWWGVPQLCLYADEQAAYRTICDKLHKQLQERDEPGLVVVAIRSLCLSPLPTGEAQKLAARMDQLLSDTDFREREFGPQGAERFPPPPRAPGLPPGNSFAPGFPRRLPWELNLYAAGLAHFRAGNARRAVELLQQVNERGRAFPSSGMTFPVLAMAWHELEKTDQAQSALADSQRTLDQWLPGIGPEPDPAMPLPWFDVLECSLLHSEAELRIHGNRSPDPLLAAEERALKHYLRQ